MGKLGDLWREHTIRLEYYKPISTSDWNRKLEDFKRDISQFMKIKDDYKGEREKGDPEHLRVQFFKVVLKKELKLKRAEVWERLVEVGKRHFGVYMLDVKFDFDIHFSLIY